MVRFNEETIKVSHPNQEIVVGAFQDGLKARQINESLAQKSTSNRLSPEQSVTSKEKKVTWKKDPEIKKRK